MDWKDLMVSAEKDDKTPHLLSVNDAINHMNTGNKNTIKGVLLTHVVLLVIMFKPADLSPMTT